jgi:hypothetical protein
VFDYGTSNLSALGTSIPYSNAVIRPTLDAALGRHDAGGECGPVLVETAARWWL